MLILKLTYFNGNAPPGPRELGIGGPGIHEVMMFCSLMTFSAVGWDKYYGTPLSSPRAERSCPVVFR